ncbi:BadF/BadG/BcrA/BcrD ATPase family protein [Clostridium sp.]|uniref:N-acetylglucosamine kinase n=1 Tax=Clostridium sp. TaxID=1506 RepID=UPI002FCB3329
MKYIIGVDGGGTKTEAIAYSLEGKELCIARTGFGNVLINEEEAMGNIISAIDQCIAKIHQCLEHSKCEIIYLGLAGSESGESSSFITRILSDKYKVKVKVVNDAVIALAALLKGEDGILTISGTGSISYGIRHGKTKSAGGWGHLLGDEGSGYFIAIEALKTLALEEDLDMEPSNLSKVIMRKIGITHREDIKNFVYSSTKGEIAVLVPVIVNTAESGEASAIEILRKSGQDLAETTLRVYRSLNFQGSVTVGIKGSILTKIDIVRSEFERVLTDNIKDVTIVDEDPSSALGAYFLALKELRINGIV